MRVDMSGERELRGEPLRAAVHHADEGLLAHVGGDVAGEPGEGGGAGGEDLAAHPETLEHPAGLTGLLGRYVNTLQIVINFLVINTVYNLQTNGPVDAGLSSSLRSLPTYRTQPPPPLWSSA